MGAPGTRWGSCWRGRARVARRCVRYAMSRADANCFLQCLRHVLSVSIRHPHHFLPRCHCWQTGTDTGSDQLLCGECESAYDARRTHATLPYTLTRHGILRLSSGQNKPLQTPLRPNKVPLPPGKSQRLRPRTLLPPETAYSSVSLSLSRLETVKLGVRKPEARRDLCNGRGRECWCCVAERQWL